MTSHSMIVRTRSKPRYRLPVSARFLPNNGDDVNSAFGAITWAQSRVKFTARGSVDEFIADAWGFALANNTGSEANQAARTVRGKLEYPEGTFFDFMWAGAVTKNIAGGSLSNLSDVLRVPGGIPGGATYYIHWEDSGGTFTLNASGRVMAGDSYATGTGTAPTLGSSYSGSTVNTKINTPNMVTALHGIYRPLVAFLGDSNTVDQTGTRDVHGVAGFPRAVSAFNNCTKFCMSGNTLSVQSGNITMRKTVMQNYGIRHCFVLLGTNDIPGSGDSSATMITQYDTLAATLAGVGITPHFMTLPPKTGGAEATRVPVNAYIRFSSGTGNYGAFFELADLVETGRDTGIWKTGYTNGDLVHILWTSSTVANVVLNGLANFYSTLK